MYGHDLEAYKTRISGFGWRTIIVDGHDFREILQAYAAAENEPDRPVMIIARTIKGKGVSLFEDKNGWHGKPLPRKDLDQALDELGEIDKSVIGTIRKPENQHPSARRVTDIEGPKYDNSADVATRNAYGKALKRIYPKYPAIVSLDAEVSNSTKAEFFKESWPERFFEMYIAEQNMAGTALGFARRGKIPFVSTFSAFMSRAYDQIRMSQYSDANIKFVGSHAGVSIGQDGPSQMGLEDIAFFRTLLDSVVLYPCDAVSTEKLVEEAAQYRGIVYLRTTRGATPVIYGPEESFPIGGCKVISQSNNDAITLISAGITLHEVLAARHILAAENIAARVIDLYSIKPIDTRTLQKAAAETDIILTVEDHFPEGGLGEAVRSALWDTGAKVASLAVRKKPKSGKPAELLDFEEISRQAIVRHARELFK
jgi:transketolase